MIIVYTGNGKGKSTAAIGHIFRAIDAGLTVSFCQFMKQPGASGEQEVLKSLLGEKNVYIGGSGYLRGQKDINKHIRAAIKTLEWAHKSKADIRILDEVIDAINLTLIHDFVLELLVSECSENEKKHLILTGKDAERCSYVWNCADYITEFGAIRHPCKKGRKAIKGIDF